MPGNLTNAAIGHLARYARAMGFRPPFLQRSSHLMEHRSWTGSTMPPSNESTRSAAGLLLKSFHARATTARGTSEQDNQQTMGSGDQQEQNNKASPSEEDQRATMEQSPDKPQHTNRLIQESSPYLLQHAHNPVDWYPWGEEAFKRAKEEDKPIFLSVGYSVCHWCHVMERESFENEEIARYMNEHFVNVKVDREERPDVDRVYMTFVQASTGSGGWPMSVFLTPDLLPFFGGTYFPPTDAFMRPGFPSLLNRISKLWEENKDDLVERGTKVIDALKNHMAPESLESSVVDQKKAELLRKADTFITECLENYHHQFDETYGGFGSAPKFPRPSIFNFMLTALDNPTISEHSRKFDLNAVTFTLKKMAQGGMYDFIGGGFARYSVDEEFMIPHFEKMLYDQGQLIATYADAYTRTGLPLFAKVVRESVDYLERDLIYVDPDDSNRKAFFSAEDADSLPTHNSTEKKEGAYYLWHYDELKELLTGDDVKLNGVQMDPFAFCCDWFDIKEKGNIPPERDPHEEFGEKNILHQRYSLSEVCEKYDISLEQGLQLSEEKIKPKLLAVREKRPHPHLDDKIITAWNGLALTGLSKAAMALDDQRDHYIDLANQVARFIETYLYDAERGVLFRNVRERQGRTLGFLQDYAFMIQGLLDLYEASAGSEQGSYWLNWAAKLQSKQDQMFIDEENGGYFDTTGKDESVLMRYKEDHDGAEPAGSSIAMLNLLRLGTSGMVDQTTAESYIRFSHKTIACMALDIIEKYPQAVPQMMVGLDNLKVAMVDHAHRQLAVVYDDSIEQESKEFIKSIHRIRGVRGHLSLIFVNTDQHDSPTMQCTLDNLPHLHDVQVRDGKPTAYLCQSFACQEPVTDIETLEKQLRQTPKT